MGRKKAYGAYRVFDDAERTHGYFYEENDALAAIEDLEEDRSDADPELRFERIEITTLNEWRGRRTRGRRNQILSKLTADERAFLGLELDDEPGLLIVGGDGYE